MNRFQRASLLFSTTVIIATTMLAQDARADETTELAQAAQNPIANMISLPLQNKTLFGIGPDDDTQNILNIQPVVPFGLSDDWNVITRTIAPLIYKPDIVVMAARPSVSAILTPPCFFHLPNRVSSPGE